MLFIVACLTGMASATSAADFATYRQTLACEFATPAEARAATLEPLVLPAGKRVAFSTRWDDSNTAHAQMARTLDSAGFKGTFYLNQVQAPFVTSTVSVVFQKGGTVGAHTEHHPYLPYFDPAAIFCEIMENRVNIESGCQAPAVAFTLPFCAFVSPADPRCAPRIGAALHRAGLLGGPEYESRINEKFGLTRDQWVPSWVFSIDDRNPQQTLFTDAVKRGMGLAETDLPGGPHFTLGVHSWQGKEGFVRLSGILKTEASRPEIWYCNENEYIAYRMQYLHNRIRKQPIQGAKAVFEIDRVEPFEVGAAVDWSVRVSGKPATAALDGQTVRMTDSSEVNLRHAAGHGVPARYYTVHNRDNTAALDSSCNRCPALGDSVFGVTADERKNVLRCLIRNSTEADWNDLVLTARLPLLWKNGIQRKTVKQLKKNAELRLDFDLGEKEPDAEFGGGRFFFAVQTDFVVGGGRVRVYGTTAYAAAPAALSLPRDTALFAGPMKMALVSDEILARQSAPSAEVRPFGTEIYQQWHPVCREGGVAGRTLFTSLKDPAWENWNNGIPKEGQTAYICLLDFQVEPARDGDTFRILHMSRPTPSFFLNGTAVENAKRGETIVTARSGINRIIMRVPLEAKNNMRYPFTLCSQKTGKDARFVKQGGGSGPF